MPSWYRRRHSLHGTLALLVALSACGGGGSDPQVPAEVELSSGDISFVGAGQSLQLTATVRDASGNTLPDAVVVWTTDDNSIAAVTATGLLTAQRPGTTQLTATAGDATATADIVVQSTSSIQIVDGNGQTAAAGAAVTTPPSVRIENASNTAVPGVRVRFTVGTASGTVTGETQVTDANGIATVGSWRLGSVGVNTLTASVDGAEINGEPAEFIATTAEQGGYNITVRYLTELSNPQLLAFAEAELRWESLITGDLDDVNQTLPASACGDNPETPGPFDDVTIFVTVEPIDGPFGVLGQAGPCFVRVGATTGDGLTVIGRMQFDEDDMELLESEGSLNAVILHEMGHVLGFGTLWGPPPGGFDLLVDPADPDTPAEEDPHFIGAGAIAAFDAAGGTAYLGGAKVPVMNVGGSGTINSHWRDEIFDPEVMTGFLSDGVNPLSAISVRSLADLGYTVNAGGADPFTLNLPTIRVAGQRRGRHMVDDIISDPIRGITPDGRVVGVLKR